MRTLRLRDPQVPASPSKPLVGELGCGSSLHPWVCNPGRDQGWGWVNQEGDRGQRAWAGPGREAAAREPVLQKPLVRECPDTSPRGMPPEVRVRLRA